MSIENQEQIPSLPPIYEIDISSGWDSESLAEVFIKKLKELGIYKPNLLFSGFNGSEIGKTYSGTRGANIVFCSKENELKHGSSGGDGGLEHSALFYAHLYTNPAVALYEAEKLEEAPEEHDGGYMIKNPSALIAIVLLK